MEILHIKNGLLRLKLLLYLEISMDGIEKSLDALRMNLVLSLSPLRQIKMELQEFLIIQNIK
jgi:hypothetical protein